MKTLINKLPHTQYILAFSSGVDSTVLKHILTRKGFDIKPIYFNHGLNKISSTDIHELNMIKSLHSDVEIIDLSLTNIKKGYENCARNERYKILHEKCVNENRSLITAHHKSDNAETFLFRLFRNSGLNGLTKMKFKSSIGGIDIYRPLIEVSKNDIISYANKNKLSWIDDKTNTNNSITRNMIRNIIIPQLNSHIPFIEDRLDSVSKNLSNANELLTELIISSYSLDNLNNSINEKYFSIILNYLLLHSYNFVLSSKDLNLIKSLLYSNKEGSHTVNNNYATITFNVIRMNTFNKLDVQYEII